jgi:oligoribonuclease NrnB/cAMP/cGMP phosphodiesterase (DHH superfamily)
MKMKVLFHDSCFDGAASAAVFTRFYRERIHPDAAFAYQGLAHGGGGSAIPEGVFDGDENAIVDFRYSQSPKLTWWFDHHASAFQLPGDEQSFRADTSGHKFHDPKAKSCTKFIARIAAEKFGFDSAPLRDLIDWAELIDGAQFTSPRQAVRLEEPALKLMMVFESNKDPQLIPRVIGEMQSKTLAQIIELPEVKAKLDPLFARHQKNIELVTSRAHIEQGVVTYDVADQVLDAINKFIPYELFPDAKYSVNVSRGAQRVKISLGSNPWKPETRTHDLSKIAEKFGGGGHPVVAAISFKAEELQRARDAAAEIIATLQH